MNSMALAFVTNVIMEIITKCKTNVTVQLCDHATSLAKQVALSIQAIHLTWANESMHPRMVFNQMEDGLKNSIC
jgi:hypothetical protein